MTQGGMMKVAACHSKGMEFGIERMSIYIGSEHVRENKTIKTSYRQ
jgi:hypothetical protein